MGIGMKQVRMLAKVGFVEEGKIVKVPESRAKHLIQKENFQDLFLGSCNA